MGITWGAILWLVVKHERLGLDYLTVLNQMAPPKNISETAPMSGILPSQRTDAKMWVRHAITLDEQGGGRLRYTTFDNSPQGREVHWNFTWVWLLRRGGKVWQKLGNDSLTIPQAIAAWSYWQSLPVFLMGLVGISTWTTRRMGAGAGLFMAWGMLGSIPFLDAFFPGNSDHPGLISAAGFGMVLGLVFAGAGWWQKSNNDAALLPASIPEARRAAGYSALCGGLGMWISAASTIPVISILGVSGFLMVLRKRGETTRLNFAPEVWRWWGRFGALGSLLAYLIEYFFHHLSWHMEVNHPVYALAWWGGAELVALAINSRLIGRSRTTVRHGGGRCPIFQPVGSVHGPGA